MKYEKTAILCLMLLGATIVAAQVKEIALPVFNLSTCLNYAQQHDPLLMQAELDQQIVNRQIKIGRSAWLPQAGFTTQFQHISADEMTQLAIGQIVYPIPLSRKNVNPFSLSVQQVVFDRDALLSSKTAKPFRQQADLNVKNQWINLKVAVTKAFYNVLLQQRQLEIYESDIKRLEQLFKDAQSQYQGGVVDKTDVQRARISLNNSRAQCQNARQQVNISYADLKQAMGYSESDDFTVQVNIQSLIADIHIDTTLLPEINNRVEFKLLETQRRLLSIDRNYARWAYIPTISLSGSYNASFTSDQLSTMYKESPFVDYAVGVSISIPLFEGFSRIHRTKLAKLNLKRNEWDFKTLKNSVDDEFVNTVSIYKSNLENYNFLKQNVEDAEEVYNIILLQYKEGVKTYLDLTSAHMDLLMAQLSYYNSIFQVIVSKVYVQKALGLIE